MEIGAPVLGVVDGSKTETSRGLEAQGSRNGISSEGLEQAGMLSTENLILIAFE
jgi:hypothetical protein